MPTILIADDHPLFREALRGAVAALLPDAEIVEAENADDLFAAADAHPHADLLLMDLGMPGAHGFSALVHLRAAQPQLPVVVVSAREDPPTMRRALDHGAAGFIPKSADTASIHAGIRAVLDGDTWAPPQTAGAAGIGPEEAEIAQRIRELSPQQYRVLSMLGAGLLNKQIAYAMDVSEATVKAHMTAVLRKLGASNRTQAVLLAGRLSLDGISIPEGGHEDEG
ncbi:response regulator [Coralloluteibacterium thermophilus]|uniref:Response regulator n=1 Tax=Coralloluteibacterium thermophilum TaxID=2707049 RepID=A0ABV9NM58_9GAMM